MQHTRLVKKEVDLNNNDNTECKQRIAITNDNQVPHITIAQSKVKRSSRNKERTAHITSPRLGGGYTSSELGNTRETSYYKY